MNNDSSWGPAGESPLDRAIDRAVREMMQIDPPAGLRRRVLSRLESSDTRRPAFLPRYVFATAALAILVLAAMFMREHGGTRVESDAPPSVASTAPPRQQPVPATEPHTAKDPKVTARGLSAPITREPIPMPRVADVFGARTTRVSAAADPGSEGVWTGDPAGPKNVDVPSNPVPPLTVTPLTAAPIETPAIIIPPLVIAGPPKGGV
jgi:hypothetical protein